MKKRKDTGNKAGELVVVGFLAESPRISFNHKQIAAATGLRDKIELFGILQDLIEAGQILETSPGKYKFASPRRIITGTVGLTQRGAAFVTTDEFEEDVFIAPYDLNHALHGDLVRISIYPLKANGKPEGEVIEVLERTKNKYVGVLGGANNYSFVDCDDKRMYIDIFIPPRHLNGAQNGDKVLAEIIDWPEDEKSPVGRITDILGKAGENNAEMHAIVAEFGFRIGYPDEVMKECDAISDQIPNAEIKSRRDFRDTLTFTIDPIDAKDFDDAISFKPLKNDLWEIGVHIADVSHYVRKNTALDREAAERATSVYLVDRTIPMLPEKISNHLCSLVPYQDRLCFAAVFHMDAEGKVHDQWFGKTVIHSRRRFTYEEAQEVLETGTGDHAEELRLLNEIAKKLKDERFRKGAIAFETEEVKFKLDEEGNPLGVFVKVRKDAHKLIEEYMLLANRKVAEYSANLIIKDSKAPMVYRVHDLPNEDKLADFSLLAKKFGYKLDFGSMKNISKSLNKLMVEVEGKPEQNILQQLAIRTMAKAVYTTQKTSHYGLAFEYYTHFTSPIRRYPDLLVHRNLFEYLNGKSGMDERSLEELAKHSSMMEQKAADAERASIKFKQAEYLSDHIGQTFKAVISGVTEWGIFAEILENKCEGLIRLNTLEDDFYIYDEKNKCIIGKRHNRKYTLGDPVEVRIKKTDPLKRTIDLSLVQFGGGKGFRDSGGLTPKRKGSWKTSGDEKPRRGSSGKGSSSSRSGPAKKGGSSKRRRRD